MISSRRRTNEKIWFNEAWNDYVYWQKQDKKALKRINSLLKDIERGNFSKTEFTKNV